MKANETIKPKEFDKNDIDTAYLIGVFNVSGMDGLAKEIKRLKSIGKNPHNIITWIHSINNKQ